MINLNELSTVPALSARGRNVWGSSPLKHHNEGEEERGRAALLPPASDVAPPLTRQSGALETVRRLNGRHPSQS